jgi:hypothetical protein
MHSKDARPGQVVVHANELEYDASGVSTGDIVRYPAQSCRQSVARHAERSEGHPSSMATLPQEEKAALVWYRILNSL